MPRKSVERMGRARLSPRFERFALFLQQHSEFYKARPVMAESDSLLNLSRFLHGEIDECFVTPDQKSKTIDAFPIADYRQQELSDVIIFAFRILEESTLGASESSFQPEKLWQALQSFSRKNLPESLRREQSPWELSGQKWKPAHEQSYQNTLTRIQVLSDLITKKVKQLEDTENVGVESRPKLHAEISHHAWEIILAAWKALCVCVQNPEDALLEKMARNMVKYPARQFQRDRGEIKTIVKNCKQEWRDIFGNEYFYGLPVSRKGSALELPLP